MFVPGGRIWYNSGRNNPQLLNCFVLSSNLDSKEGWGNIAKEMIITSMTGGGCGIDFSDVRPRGAPISGQNGECPGPVELMKLVNACAEPVKAGGARRVALMFSLDLDHPDVEEFLDAKLTKGELTFANVSVRSKNTTEFIKAVRKDSDWELSWKGKYKKTIKAKALWDKIVTNAYNSAEPGFLNWEKVEDESNISYIENLVTTNPCITGDTLIATADGRNAVSIEQLTDERKDIPVYSTNLKTGQVEIKLGRNPRKTGEKKEVWKLTLDDGSFLKATPNHKILLKNLKYVELKNLKPGDSITPFNSFNSNNYRQICGTGKEMLGGTRRNRRQYRLINEFYNGEVDPKTYAIHHLDFNSLNDNISNLQVITHKEHQKIHSEKMIGKNNPYHKMTDEWKFQFASHKGKKNPRYIDISNQELIKHGKKLFNKLGKLSVNDWTKYAKENGLPQSLNSDFRFGNFANFRNQVTQNHKVVSVEFYGYEDVYNITVDDNNNYMIINSFEDNKYVVSSGICIKNCGEIALSSYDCCCLGHIVLSRFITTEGDIDWHNLANTIRSGVRFLDNVLTVNNYPLPEMKEKSHKLRRIGLGTTALADTLALLGYKYGSEEGNSFVDKLFKFIAKTSYESSVMLAVEKGAFPACNPSKHIETGYMKRMPKKIRALVEEHGIRNACILTQAPTGTVSIISGNCSSGIEPMFAPAYERRYWDKNERKTELVFHPLFEQFMKEGKKTSHLIGSHELSVEQHMEVQKIVQKYIDNAVSKTINIPSDYPVEEVAKLWLDYLPSLKGTTFYRVDSRGFYNEETGKTEEPPLKAISLKEARDRFKEVHATEVATVDDCPSGICQI